MLKGSTMVYYVAEYTGRVNVNVTRRETRGTARAASPMAAIGWAALEVLRADSLQLTASCSSISRGPGSTVPASHVHSDPPSQRRADRCYRRRIKWRYSSVGR